MLLVIRDATSDFLYVDFGTNERVSDGGVWDLSNMNVCTENGNAALPPDSMLPLSERTLTYVFVADDALPLKRHILKPFPHCNKNRSTHFLIPPLSGSTCGRKLLESQPTDFACSPHQFIHLRGRLRRLSYHARLSTVTYAETV